MNDNLLLFWFAVSEERIFTGFSRQECLRWWDCQRGMLHAPELEAIPETKETPHGREDF